MVVFSDTVFITGVLLVDTVLVTRVLLADTLTKGMCVRNSNMPNGMSGIQE